MRFSRTHAAYIAAWLAPWFATACGCGDDHVAPLDAGTDADLTVDAAPADDAAPNSDDGAVDDAETPSVRRLVEQPLFGALAVENGIYDPFFTGSGSWIAIQGNSDFAAQRRIQHSDAPLGAPILEVGGTDDLFTFAYARTPEGPSRVSVLVGAREDASDTLDRVKVYFATLDSSGDSEWVDVPRDESFEEARHVGFVFRRHSVDLPTEAVGLSSLIVEGRDGYAIAAPQVVAQSGSERALRPLRNPVVVEPTPDALRAYRAAWREWLGNISLEERRARAERTSPFRLPAPLPLD